MLHLCKAPLHILIAPADCLYSITCTIVSLSIDMQASGLWPSSQMCCLQVLVLLAQIQLHMLSQQTAAALELLSSCSSLFREQAQQPHPHPQPLWSQLQLQFCILRVLVMLMEGRYVELMATGQTRVFCVQQLRGGSKCVCFLSGSGVVGKKPSGCCLLLIGCLLCMHPSVKLTC